MRRIPIECEHHGCHRRPTFHVVPGYAPRAAWYGCKQHAEATTSRCAVRPLSVDERTEITLARRYREAALPSARRQEQ